MLTVSKEVMNETSCCKMIFVNNDTIITFNATFPSQDQINPKTHLCRTFMLGILDHKNIILDIEICFFSQNEYLLNIKMFVHKIFMCENFKFIC